MEEHFFQCPYCWEQISMLLDPSVSTLEYVEDCEVCCNPIEINAHFTDNQLISFTAEGIQQ